MSSTYEVGDTIALDFAVAVAGVPTNATVTLAISQPDGTVVNATPTNPSTGNYAYVFTAAQWGRHTYRWVATGAATAADSGAFTIGGAVSLADVKEHLRITSDDLDAQLQKFIDRATTAMSHYVGPLVPTTVTRVLDGGEVSLILPDFPVLSLTSVGYADGSMIDLDDLDLDLSTGIVHWGYGTAGRFTGGSRYVTATYTAGWQPVPEDLQQAVLELVRHLWETQRGNKPGRASGDETQSGSFGTWPPRVQELIAPYRVPVVT